MFATSLRDCCNNCQTLIIPFTLSFPSSLSSVALLRMQRLKKPMLPSFPSLRLLFTSLGSGHRPLSTSPPTNESVIYMLKMLDKKPDKALSFFNCVKAQHNFKPGPRAYDLMLRILAHKDTMKDFWPLLKSMDEEGHSIEQSTYLTLLDTFKKQKLTAESSALAKFHSRATENSKLDTAIVSAAKIVQDSSKWELKVEKKLEKLNLSLSELTVAKILREAREYPLKALSFFQWSGRQPGYKNGSLAHNAMARILGREVSVSEFWTLVREMKAEGHEMDIDTYIKLSRQFQKSKMMKDAVELYEFMMDGPYKPSVQDCSLLLRRIALSSSPDLDLVFRVVRKYEAAGYTLSKVEYDGIHRSLTSNCRFDEAEEILRKMKEMGYEPDNITYSQLVYGLCKAKKLDEACKVLDEMEESECVPDLKTWTILIQGHCSAGEVDKGLECLTRMIEKGSEADGDVVDVLVKGLCSEKRVDGAYTLLTEMVDKARLRPWQATYKYLIQELLRAGRLEEALKLLVLMKSHNLPPFADPFGPYISKYGTIEDAREFLRSLTVNNYPTSAAYLNVFKSFFNEGRYSEAQDLLYKCPHHIRKHVDICKLFGSIKDVSAA